MENWSALPIVTLTLRAVAISHESKNWLLEYISLQYSMFTWCFTEPTGLGCANSTCSVHPYPAAERLLDSQIYFKWLSGWELGPSHLVLKYNQHQQQSCKKDDVCFPPRLSKYTHTYIYFFGCHIRRLFIHVNSQLSGRNINKKILFRKRPKSVLPYLNCALLKTTVVLYLCLLKDKTHWILALWYHRKILKMSRIQLPNCEMLFTTFAWRLCTAASITTASFHALNAVDRLLSNEVCVLKRLASCPILSNASMSLLTSNQKW